MVVEEENDLKIEPGINMFYDLSLESGYSYLIKNKNQALNEQIFTNKKLVGETLLYITRNPPKEGMNHYDITNKTMIWLTYNKGPNCIEPTNITRLSLKIQEFLRNHKSATIIFEGLEYLTSQNDFSTILHFLQLMNDKIMISDSKLILSLNPNAFKPNELAQIEREMESLDE